jgi:hypothetical protein
MISSSVIFLSFFLFLFLPFLHFSFCLAYLAIILFSFQALAASHSISIHVWFETRFFFLSSLALCSCVPVRHEIMWGDVRPCSFMSTYIRLSNSNYIALRCGIWYGYDMIHLSSWPPPYHPQLSWESRVWGWMVGRTLGSAKPAPHTAHHKRKEETNHSLHIYYCHFCGVELYFCLFGFVQRPYVLHLRLFFSVWYLCVLLLILYLCSRHLKHKTWAMRDYHN